MPAQNYAINEFAAFQDNFSGVTQPSSDEGVSISCHTGNAMGAWSDLMGGTVNDDSYGIWINVQFGTQTGTCACLIDIGVDYSGGTSYSVLIPTLGYAGEVQTGGETWRGCTYYFPLFIPKGARLGVRGQTKNAATITSDIKCKLAQKPSRPDVIRYGTYVDALGVDAANSRGTVYVPGTAGWGSYVSLGTSLREAWWWQAGFVNDATSGMTNNPFMADIAVGNVTSKLTLGSQLYVGHKSDGSVPVGPNPTAACHGFFPSGSTFYVRGWEHNGVDSNYTAMIYLLGGG